MTRAIARDPIYRGRRFQSEIIELCVRWYLTYRLSYRDLVEMMAERGVTLSHSTIHVPPQALDRVCGQNDAFTLNFSVWNSKRANPNAANAPANCAKTNPGASMGRIPENVLVSDRAMVMAGFANEVDAVNQ
jgi:hypothetical protein